MIFFSGDSSTDKYTNSVQISARDGSLLKRPATSESASASGNKITGIADGTDNSRPRTSSAVGFVDEDEQLKIKLRKVESFLEAQRRRETEQADNARRQLRGRKREQIPGASPGGNESSGGEGGGIDMVEQMRKDVREFRKKFSIRYWK